jgi:hypothetical protein
MIRLAFTSFALILASNAYSDQSIQSLLNDVRAKNKQDSQYVRESKRGNKPREHYIDPYRVERLAKEKDANKACDDIPVRSFKALTECMDKQSTILDKSYPDRGTNAYGEKNYSVLSKELALAKREELLDLLDYVAFQASFDTKNVELTVDHIKSEIFFIEKNVLKINPRDYETR